ncbi:unnamed protein product [Sphenostylis stenocarpa]|uniref:Uncharacterized protein n=1 Tax=Sphenostylis stenocarpa TaxID=92480 RepID=A0AA86S1D4_9FABA|nr:unnamed protein product [Sphenostylis stenocarpa]
MRDSDVYERENTVLGVTITDEMVSDSTLFQKRCHNGTLLPQPHSGKFTQLHHSPNSA